MSLQVFYAYTYGTAAWYSLQGFALAASPKVILTMLADETRHATGKLE